MKHRLAPPIRIFRREAWERIISLLELWLIDLRRDPDRVSRLFPPLLGIFTLLVWSPTLFIGLDMSSWDDYFHLTSMARQHSWSDIVGWFQHGYWAYTHLEYRPLTRLGLLLTYWIFGPHLYAFHLSNIFWHFICAWLAGAILAQFGVGKWPSRIASLIWVLFPQALMAVRWINGRQDLQCAAFILLAVWGFAKWLSGKSFWYLIGSGLAVQLAAFTKEPGAIAPLFLLVAAFTFPNRRPARQKLAAVAIISLLLIPYAYLRFRAYPWWQTINDAPWRTPGDDLHVLVKFLLVPSAYELFTTLRQMGWLILFSATRHIWLVEQFAFWAGIVVLLRRHPRLILLALAWKLIFWLPVMKLYWNPVFTHYRYLPNIATSWLVAAAAWELGVWASACLKQRWRPVARGGLVLAAFALLLFYYWTRLGLGVFTWSRLIAGDSPGPPTLWKELVFTQRGREWLSKDLAEPPCPPEEYISRLRPATPKQR